jgi:hypothetical protein
MNWLKVTILVIFLLAGCAMSRDAQGPYVPVYDFATHNYFKLRRSRPCWYDEQGPWPGHPYQDERGQTYYLGYDVAARHYYKITGGSPYPTPANPYIYQPGPEAWTRLYKWGMIRGYVFPKCER